MMTQTLVRARTLGLLTLLAVVGCDDGGSAPPTDASVPDQGEPEPTPDEGVLPLTQCTPDPAALDTPRDCLHDADCPCASHCRLGQCARECVSNAECDREGVCDRFGRCRDAAVIARNPLAARAPIGGGRMVPSRVRARLGADSAPTPIVLVARGDVGAVRIVAPPGLRVGASGADFGAEVIIEGPFEDGEQVEVEVMADPDAPAAPELPDPTLQVYTDSNEGSAVAVGEGPPLLVPEVDEAPALDGEYAGYARLMRAGFGGGRAGIIERDFSIPLTAQVFDVGDRAIIAIDDALGVLHPDGRWVGEITLGDTPSLTLPAIEWLAPERAAGLTAHVVVEAAPAELRQDPTAPDWIGVLAAGITVEYTGIGLGGATPMARWSIGLQRQRDLPPDAEAPAVGLAAQLVHAPAAASEVRFPLEATFMSALGEPDVVSARRALEMLLDPGALTGDRHDIHLCNPTTSDADAWRAFGALVLGGLASPAGSADIFQAWDPPAQGADEVAQHPHPFVAGIARALIGPGPEDPIRTVAWRWTGEPTLAFESVDGDPIPYAVPCGLDLRSNGVRTSRGGAAFGFDFSASQFDACEIAAATGACSPTSVSHMPVERRTLPPVTIDVLDERQGPIEVREVEVLVDTVCVMPQRPMACAEGLLCRTEDGNLGGFDTRAHPISGDLSCATDPGLMMPLDDEVPADQLRAACAVDLEAINTAIAESSQGDVEAQLNALGWNAQHGCLNPLRFIALLGLASERARQTPFNPLIGDPTSDVIAARLLQRWLEVHALFANDAGALALSITPGEGAPLALLEAQLQRSIAGWPLLFLPRIGSALSGLSPDALYEPDYRTRVRGAATGGPADQSLGHGLIVTMAETLTAQMELMALIVARRARAGERVVAPEIQAAMRTFLTADALLRGLLATSALADHDQAPRWTPLADRARARTQRTLARLMLQLDAMVRGNNPLGIEDTDLPLYFRELSPDPSSRFTAISSHILGDGPDSGAWAPSLVRAALDTFEAARASGAREQARVLNVAVDADEHQGRVDTAYRSLGELAQDLCGADRFDSRDGISIGRSLPDDFDPQTCWFDAANAACTPPPPEPEDPAVAEGFANTAARHGACILALSSSVQPDRYESCIAIGCATAAGRVEPYPPLHALQEHILDEWEGVEIRTLSLQVYWTPVPFEIPAAVIPEGVNPCRNAQAPGVTILLPEADIDPETGDVVLTCAPAEGFGGPTWTYTLDSSDYQPDFDVPTGDLIQAQRTCDAFFPQEAPLDLSIRPTTPPECFSGSLGTEAVTLKALVTDVDIARAELDALVEAYTIGMQSCYRQQQGNAALQETTASFVEVTNRKLRAREAWGHVSIWAGTVGSCLDSVAGAGKGPQLLAGGGACAAHAIQGVADSVSLNLETQMQRLSLAHDQTIAVIEQATDEDRCFIEAELELVDANTARLTIQRAIEELSSGYVGLRQTLEDGGLQVERARADVADAEGSTARRPGRDAWLDRDRIRYHRALRLARRATYLAVRAVEYEFQANLLARGDALLAEHPDDLDQVLQDLRDVAATGRINGAPPAELTEVFSLRDHLLQLGSRVMIDPREQPLTPAERFRLYLTDPRFEVHSDGEFAGRLLPFSLAPLGALNRGNTGGVPIVSDNACAERLWSVNVSIQGDPERTFRGIAPQVNLEIRQRNTFYSNWCSPADSAFQVASVRPGRNLFREPGIGEGVALDGQDPTQRFAKARIQAQLDVPPGDFIDDRYTDGASSELAARALYGDYALFIPVTSLAALDEDGAIVGDGLVIDAIDDILLRVDYLSVAR